MKDRNVPKGPAGPLSGQRPVRRAPDHLKQYAWYLPHQAWLAAQGLPHHDPEGTDPQRANLADANLAGANLDGANLDGASFAGCSGQPDYSSIVEAIITRAMLKASEQPGLYGGRYVARKWNQATRETEYLILDDDDPERYQDDEDLDIFCQATPGAAYGIGHARFWINRNGTIDREYLTHT